MFLRVVKVVRKAAGNGHVRVKALDQLEDGAEYIACGAEKVNKTRCRPAQLLACRADTLLTLQTRLR